MNVYAYFNSTPLFLLLVLDFACLKNGLHLGLRAVN